VRIIHGRGLEYEAIFGKFFDQRLQESLTEKHCQDGHVYAKVPVLDEWHLLEQVAEFRTVACKALIAQAGWELEKPRWAPRLPLNADAIGKLRCDPRPRFQVMGHYAASLRAADWSPHPSFDDYCAGLCALPRTAGFMHNDGLWRTPRPLAGLEEETLCWFTPAQQLERKIEDIRSRYSNTGDRNVTIT
jgi:hypothetical protein